MDARLLGLLQSGALRALDAHFADLLLRHAARPTPQLALAAALASRHAGDGHVCLPLPRLAGQAPFEASPWRAPPLADWREALLRSGVVGEPGAAKPLILDAAGRLYLERLWRDEDRLARDLSARAAPRADIDPAALAAPLRRLFPGDDPGTVGQRRAAAVAALHGLGILCGGPGTGKTHTVARLLALLVELVGSRPPRIALAAPTGKAAQRLAESLRKSADVLPAGFKLPDNVPTLHRLLGLRPDGSVRHDADHPLACDLLLIDEASMVDLPLLARTLCALPAQARLILLGDPNQLASVEAGAVLGELCAGAGGYSPAGAARLAVATGDAAPGGGPGGIGDAIALLTHSYRFDGGGAIGRLAAAVNAGDAAGALALLHAGGAVCFEAVDTPAVLAARIGAHVVPALQRLFEAGDGVLDPGAALARLGEFQVLTAL
ncbi:AAA family ATPase, partial [Immundisolibacter sp.]|uniref:AAA family ATPase n=1 Tax=Immundisolibacter sp. TaxID=1934948 RepID=UPI00261A9252